MAMNNSSRWAPAILLSSGISQYVGASLAIGLFVAAPALSVAWGRIVVGAIIMLLWRRTFLRKPGGQVDWRGFGAAVLFGVVLGAMNLTFYASIARIPMGTAVSLEYIGPVLLAALVGRGWKVRAGIVFACVGVFLISWAGVDLKDPSVALGVGLAFAAGVLWAGYMWLGHKLATGTHSLDSLAWAMVAASLVFAPVGAPHIGPIVGDWKLLLTMIGVGALSSALPYAIDQIVMKRIPAATFALLNSLLPATSVGVGIFMLKQVPNLAEVAGLVAISIAVALATTSERRR